MSPTAPTQNPSQTVERIREIIVGRELERLQNRIQRLESGQAGPVRAVGSGVSEDFEDRLVTAEARVEALKEHVQRMDYDRSELEKAAIEHRQEAHRLAARIHEIAREKAEAVAFPAVEGLERKLGVWLTDFQRSLQERLDERDREMGTRIEREAGAMRELVEERLNAMRPGLPGDVEERMGRIATAARMLMESADMFSKGGKEGE